MTEFKELRDTEYTRLRKRLLKTKGDWRQREFLETVRDSEAFLESMDQIATVGSKDSPLAPHPMTESEFKEPPADTEQALFSALGKLKPAVACRSAFWACVTLEHIRNERIESVYLAANGGSHPGGAERIDSILADSTTRSPQRIDSCVRAVFRRLGGLPEVRGNRSVYVDCPLARAWWRECFVEQASNGDVECAAQVRKLVRINQTYWEKLIDRVVFRNSTFGSSNIRNAFFRTLAAKIGQGNSDSDIRDTNELQRLCRRVAAYQGYSELSILDDEELGELMVSVTGTP